MIPQAAKHHAFRPQPHAAVRNAVPGIPPGAEKPIPDQHGRAGVAVGPARIARVAPAVQFGHAEDGVEPPEAEVHVGAAERPMDVTQNVGNKKDVARGVEYR